MEEQNQHQSKAEQQKRSFNKKNLFKLIKIIYIILLILSFILGILSLYSVFYGNYKDTNILELSKSICSYSDPTLKFECEAQVFSDRVEIENNGWWFLSFSIFTPILIWVVKKIYNYIFPKKSKLSL